MNRNQWLYQNRVSELDASPFHGLDREARVISKKETITPNGNDIAKGDLSGKVLYQISTCWWEEVNFLDHVITGKKLAEKVDPQKPMQVFPNHPWERHWVLGK